MVHATLQKFDYPQSCLWEDDHWAVLLRPQQATLGALVLCAKSEVTSLAELSEPAFVSFGAMCKRIDKALMQFRPFDKINYLAFMMVDPQVHFHVLPRYAEPQEFYGISFIDTGWPALPNNKNVTALSDDQRAALISALRDASQC